MSKAAATAARGAAQQAAPQAAPQAAKQGAPKPALYTSAARLYVDGKTVAPGATVALSRKQAAALAGFVNPVETSNTNHE